MAMNRFLILTNRDDSEIVEYDYAWYWVNGYEYVDARFLYLGHSRKVSLNYVELFAYKLFYMNPSCNNQDVFNVVDSICTSKIENGTPLYLKTEDYKQAINYAYNNIPNVKDWKRLVTCKFPKEINIKNRPTPLKRVQFKHNLKGLLQMNEEEAIKYNSMNTQKQREDYKFNLIKRKKANYAMSLDKKHRVLKTKQKIYSAIDALSEVQEVITRQDVSKLSGINIRTVSKYVDFASSTINKFPEFSVVVNQKEMSKIKTFDKLKESYDAIFKDKGKVSKIELHRHSGTSRVTIDKYWNKLNN